MTRSSRLSHLIGIIEFYQMPYNFGDKMEEQKTMEALAAVEVQEPAPAPALIQSDANRYSLDRLKTLAEFAVKLAKSEYRSPSNHGYNALSAILLGDDLGINPVQAMIHISVINGRPHIDGQLAISLANMKAPIRGPIRFDEKGEGEKMSCVAWVIDRNTGARYEYPMSIDDAKRAGWYQKNGSQWQKIPRLMLRYRSATYLIRSTYPEVLMGVMTTDEAEDIQAFQVEAEQSDVTEQLQLEVKKDAEILTSKV